MQNEGVGKPEGYSSGGRGVGIVGIVIMAAVFVYGLLDRGAGYQAWFLSLLVLMASLTWVVLVRPAIVLHADELELRNLVSSRWIPYGVITGIEIKQVTKVWVSGQEYVGAGFGRTRRVIRREGITGPAAVDALASRDGLEDHPGKASLARLVEDKLTVRIQRERRDGGTSTEIRRTWAWPEIALVSAVAVVTLVLGLVG